MEKTSHTLEKALAVMLATVSAFTLQDARHLDGKRNWHYRCHKTEPTGGRGLQIRLRINNPSVTLACSADSRCINCGQPLH